VTVVIFVAAMVAMMMMMMMMMMMIMVVIHTIMVMVIVSIVIIMTMKMRITIVDYSNKIRTLYEHHQKTLLIPQRHYHTPKCVSAVQNQSAIYVL
jgi:type IV secretory pathway VirB3-like protein